MALRETERFKSYLQRDKDWLNQLYCSPNSQNDKRILNFASDAKLDTLIKYLHFLSNGIIKIRRQSFESIEDKWSRELVENGDVNIVMLLVGNKSDLEDKREVSFEEA